MRIEANIIITLVCALGANNLIGATNVTTRSTEETRCRVHMASNLPKASRMFGRDMNREVSAFQQNKAKYMVLIKRWASIYLKQIQAFGPRTLFVAPFAEDTYPVIIYDYEGSSFWEIGNIKSFENPNSIPPALVTKIYTFDFLLAGANDEDARAEQTSLIKWRVANCVLDGIRVDVSSNEVVSANLGLNLEKIP